MNLLEVVGIASEVGDLARRARDSLAPQLPNWCSDEESFYRHFGASYEEFAEIVARLAPDQTELLQKTLDVNPEAAVLWILAMEEVS